MLLKNRQCRISVYELTKSKFINDIIVIRALKYTRSDPGLWNKSDRFKFLFKELWSTSRTSHPPLLSPMSVQNRSRNNIRRTY